MTRAPTLAVVATGSALVRESMAGPVSIRAAYIALEAGLILKQSESLLSRAVRLAKVRA